MVSIMSTMTEDSQYDDYAIAFEEIESIVESLGESHAVSKAYNDLMKEMYICKGSLDCASSDLEVFAEYVRQHTMR